VVRRVRGGPGQAVEAAAADAPAATAAGSGIGIMMGVPQAGHLPRRPAAASCTRNDLAQAAFGHRTGMGNGLLAIWGCASPFQQTIQAPSEALGADSAPRALDTFNPSPGPDIPHEASTSPAAGPIRPDDPSPGRDGPGGSDAAKDRPGRHDPGRAPRHPFVTCSAAAHRSRATTWDRCPI
jgi:hypothetical protein